MATGSVNITAGTGTPIRTVANAGVDSGAYQQVMTLADSAGNLINTPRTPIVLSAAGVTSVTTEALFSLNIWKGGTVTSGTSYSVTTGKTFRVTAVQFGSRFITPSTTVTFASAKFNLRAAISGAAAVGSPLVYSDTKLSAANTPTPNSDLAIPDGIDFPAGYGIGVTHLDSAVTLALDVLIVGYEF